MELRPALVPFIRFMYTLVLDELFRFVGSNLSLPKVCALVTDEKHPLVLKKTICGHVDPKYACLVLFHAFSRHEL